MCWQTDGHNYSYTYGSTYAGVNNTTDTGAGDDNIYISYQRLNKRTRRNQ